ncbi:MAG: hypothetical protein C4520_14480 [Candidatus Abyssobacteria bacterium SURF_5]|uniref:YfhO family protein n=1 Tax=Abyssobacteria bacterium (strain SURF_5) TaxID=2093360 RepID=A0A3A4NJN6_ABYX5|nr:MAG: hypothetical protein C4520_14480 [Candidatus Abyssubacteria bacterium SURF_5]
MRRLYSAGLAAGAFLVFVAVCLHIMRAAGSTPYPTVANADLYDYFYPYLVFARETIAAGSLPLWTPFQATGSPVFAAIQTGLLYPFNWIIFLFGVPAALTIVHFLNVMVSVAGTILYARRLGLNAPAVAFAAVCVGFTTFTRGFHPATGATICWMPLIFFLAHRLFDKPGFAGCVMLAAALSMSFLGGNIQYLYYMSGILAVYCVFILLFSRNEYRVRGLALRYGLFVLAFVLMAGLVSIQMLPTLELVHNSTRELSRTFPEGSPFDYLLAAPLAILLGNFTSLTLIVALAFGSKKHLRIVLLLAALRVYSIVFVLSKGMPAISFLGNLPLSDTFRWHIRMLDVSMFMFSIVAAIGVSSLFDREPFRIWDRAKGRLSLFWFFISGFTLYLLYMNFKRFLLNTEKFSLYPYLLFAGFLLFFFLMMRSPGFSGVAKKRAAWAVAILLSADFLLPMFSFPPVPAFAKPRPTGSLEAQLEWIRKNAATERVLLIPGDNWCTPNVGSIYGFFNINSYETFTLSRWKNFLQFVMGPVEMEAKDLTFNGAITRKHLDALIRDAHMTGLTSLRYLVAAESRWGELVQREAAQNPAWKPLAGDAVPADLLMFENRMALPRTYLVSVYVIARDETDSLQKMRELTSGRSSSVVLEGGAPSFASAVATADLGEIEITGYDRNEVTVHAATRRPCLAVLTDTFYPGWAAYVDGAKAPIWRANSLFRAVEIPPGEHMIAFRYEPASLRWGARISVLTVIGILIGLFFEHRLWKKRKNREVAHEKPQSAAESAATVPSVSGPTSTGERLG